MKKWLRVTPEQLNREVPGMIVWRYGNPMAWPGMIVGLALMVVGSVALCIWSPSVWIDLLIVLFTVSAIRESQIEMSKLWRYKTIRRSIWGKQLAALVQELADRADEYDADEAVPGNPLYVDWEERFNEVWRKANLALGLVVTDFTPVQ